MKTNAIKIISVVLALVLLAPLSLIVMPQTSFANPSSTTKSQSQGNLKEIPFKESNTVVLILAPYVTWNDISLEKTPAIWEDAQKFSVGDINSRSRAKDESGLPSYTEGALTISSGAWPRIDTSAFGAYNIGEFFERGDAGSAYSRMIGKDLGDDEIVYLGLPKTIKANQSNSFKILPGLLGTLIREEGGVTAAFGNSDLGYSGEAERIMRPAAVTAMDMEGRVMRGVVSERVVTRDNESPYGVRTDLEALKEAMLESASEVNGSKFNLVVVDPGDLYRARMYSNVVSDEVYEEHWNLALKSLDDIYKLVGEIYPGATRIVSAQAALGPGNKIEGFGPIMISDTEPGLIVAASTQRAGLITNLDLSSTILKILSIEQPVEVLGSAAYTTQQFSLRLVGTSPNTAENRIDILKKMNATAVAVDTNRYPVLNSFIASIVILLTAGAITIIRARNHWTEKAAQLARRIIKLGILFVLSFPAASWLMFLIYRWPQTPTQVTGQFFIVVFALWGFTILLTWKFKKSTPLIFLATLTTLVIVVDQILKAPASFISFFGYSPIMAFRFYGIGNEGAAVLFGAVAIAIVLALDHWRDGAFAKHMKSWGVPVIGFIVVLISAAPFYGANVGVAAWGTVGFGVLWVLVNGKKLNWKNWLLIFIAVVLVTLAFIAVDSVAGESKTHLGRAIDSGAQGGIEPLLEIVLRKVQTNLRVLTATNLVFLLLAVIGFLAVMRWRPTKDFAVTLEKNPYFAHGMTTILITGVAAYFTEDSGIVLPALMVLYLGCSVVWLMLDSVSEA